MYTFSKSKKKPSHFGARVFSNHFEGLFQSQLILSGMGSSENASEPTSLDEHMDHMLELRHSKELEQVRNKELVPVPVQVLEHSKEQVPEQEHSKVLVQEPEQDSKELVRVHSKVLAVGKRELLLEQKCLQFCNREPNLRHEQFVFLGNRNDLCKLLLYNQQHASTLAR